MNRNESIRTVQRCAALHVLVSTHRASPGFTCCAGMASLGSSTPSVPREYPSSTRRASPGFTRCLGMALAQWHMHWQPQYLT